MMQNSDSKKRGAKALAVSKLLQSFILDQRCRGNSIKTVKFYEHGVNKFIRFLEQNYGNDDIEYLTLDTIRTYILELKSCKKWDSSKHIETKDEPITSKSVQTYVRALKTFVSWCEEEGFIPEGAARKIKLPKAVNKQVEILNEDEISKIFNYLKEKKVNHYRDLLIFSTYLETGARLEEIVNLKIDDVRINSGILKVLGKGQKERYIPFGANLQKLFFNYLNLERPEAFSDDITNLFLKENGKPITRDTVRQLFRRLKKATGIERLHPHLLRHTMITMSLISDSNIFALKNKTGHASFEIMNNYLHMAENIVNMKTKNLSLLDKLL